MHTDQVVVRLSPAGLRALRWVAEPPALEAATAAAGAPDEHGWVVTRLPVESVDIAFPQLLRLGPEVEVLSPDALRSRMRDAAQRLTALYA
jgi:predicted DNA-binding transcriptional regulator YafY